MKLDMVELIDIAPARTSKKQYTSDIPVWSITLDQIESITGHIKNKEYTAVSSAPQSSNLIDEDNLLYSKLRPYLNKVIIPDSFGVATTELVPLCPDKTRLCNKYLLYYLRSDKYVNWASKTVVGAKMPRLNMKEFWKHKIPLPPLETQKRIVEILDRAQALIDKRKEQIALMDQLIQSLFNDMFGDPVTNPKNSPLKKLQELYINYKDGTKCGPFGSALKKSEYVSSGIPVWNMDNITLTGTMLTPFRMWITPEKFDQLSSYSVLDGDVLISRAGTVGKMCVANMLGGKSIISTNLIRVRFGNKLLPIYFVSLLTYCKGRVGRLKTGSDGSFTHMNTGILDKLIFPYPPLTLQNTFADRVQKIEAQKEAMTTSLKELEDNFNSLMQRAFKGELV